MPHPVQSCNWHIQSTVQRHHSQSFPSTVAWLRWPFLIRCDQAVSYPCPPYYQPCHCLTEIQARVSRWLTLPHILQFCSQLWKKFPSCLFQSIHPSPQQYQHISSVVLLKLLWHFHVDWVFMLKFPTQEHSFTSTSSLAHLKMIDRTRTTLKYSTLVTGEERLFEL